MAITRLGTKALPTGNVIQVVTNDFTATQTITATSSFADIESSSSTTFETSITPSSSSNKILILPHISIRIGNSTSIGEFRVEYNYRAKIGSGSYADVPKTERNHGHYDYGNSGILSHAVISFPVVYSPNTTDEVKIAFQLRKLNSGNTLMVNTSDGEGSHCTLMEIKG